MKPKYQNNAKLCYMNTDSFIIDIKTEDLYKNIGDNKILLCFMTELVAQTKNLFLLNG